MSGFVNSRLNRIVSSRQALIREKKILTREGSGFQYSPAQQEILFESANFKFRIVPKGRRLGITRGLAQACVEWMDQGWPMMWGDTIHGNIERYYERYLLPALKAYGKPYRWRSDKKILTLGSGYIDFRSADNPTNWEGFGYKVIILNEAGIILDNPYLWQNAVLPMLIDYPDSSVIAAGTPKMSQNMGELFRDLWLKVKAGTPGYWGKQYSTYDNPFLDQEAIDTLVAEIPEAEIPQEIYGEFIDPSTMGSYFKRQWFGIQEEVPAQKDIVRIARVWDLAATAPSVAEPNPDWTIGIKYALLRDKTTIVLDLVKLRGEPPDVDALIVATAHADGRGIQQYVPRDPAAAGKTTVHHYATLPALQGYPLVMYPQTKQKNTEVWARPLSTKAKAGLVRVLRAPWNDFFFSQLTAYPNEKVHDDVVSALATAEANLRPEVGSKSYI